jgi:hypothetical protein
VRAEPTVDADVEQRPDGLEDGQARDCRADPAKAELRGVHDDEENTGVKFFFYANISQ